MKESALFRQPELVVWFLLTDISRIFRQLVDEETKKLGWPRASWYMLAHIYHWNGLNQQELARLMDISKSSAARMAIELEQRGWVVREVDESDKRAWRVMLAPKMAPVLRKLSDMARICIFHSFRKVDAKQMQQIVSLLRKLEMGLEGVRDSAVTLEIDSLRTSIKTLLRSEGMQKENAVDGRFAGRQDHQKANRRGRRVNGDSLVIATRQGLV